MIIIPADSNSSLASMCRLLTPSSPFRGFFPFFPVPFIGLSFFAHLQAVNDYLNDYTRSSLTGSCLWSGWWVALWSSIVLSIPLSLFPPPSPEFLYEDKQKNL